MMNLNHTPFLEIGLFLIAQEKEMSYKMSKDGDAKVRHRFENNSSPHHQLPAQECQ